jgi:hypothetical protein
MKENAGTKERNPFGSSVLAIGSTAPDGSMFGDEPDYEVVRPPRSLPAGRPLHPRGRCPRCYAEDNQRRKTKQRDQGRTTRRWKNLARAAKQAAGYRCQICDRPEIRDSRGWLSVHLRPELGGNHRAATLDDVVVLCLSCHGTLDAPRAQG